MKRFIKGVSILTIDEAKKVVEKERLQKYVCFDERDICRADRAVLCKRDADWCVYMTDERGSLCESSRRTSRTLEDALDNLIKVGTIIRNVEER